ncbi:uncharacterized protein LOC133135067 [Conger conger]|uniref:uncharacterized protein LOC133135067 n=1 Tax=Conger conger TaxID=82655 RepID=UPI002A5AE1E4|nr:uncharacterized protein LOC133135067 [Conger conger]
METSIVKVTKGLTKAADCRDDTKLLMQPYANWEEYLTPAPMSIAILGELIFISSKTDFSVRKGGPDGGFKYAKYPDSFRACLMQVCNSGWRAFNEAHKNMDQIRLYTNSVPNYIKTAVKILLQDDDNLVQAMLPDQLDNIKNIADDCLQLAESTEERFTEVIELIHELLESCTSAKQVYGAELEEVRKKIDESELRQAASEEANKRAELAFNNMSKQLEEAQESFKTSMASMPDGWTIMGMDFAGAMADSVTSVFSGIASIITAPVALPKKIYNDIGKTISSSGSKSAGQMASDNARFRIEQSRAQLDKVRDIYEKCADNMEKNRKEMTEILVTMRNCKVKEIGFSETIKILSEGLQAMGKVKEQWQKLVRFFQMVSNLMKTSLTKSLEDFAKTGEKASNTTLKYSSKMFLKDMIYSQAFYASNIASLVNMIAGTYTEVSDKYLMDPVSRLSKLMCLEVGNTEFDSERLQFADSCEVAEKGIRNLVMKNKDNFERKTMQRLEKIESGLMAVLPPESEEKKREIQEAVEIASKEDEEEDQYA